MLRQNETPPRLREKGFIVYPVYSRRSGGLSLGINLFPGKKCCSFNCPYCEVFPFFNEADFSPKQMEKTLRADINAAMAKNEPIKDICFSGNGEPTMSGDFPEALRLAGQVRNELVNNAALVLITNGAGFLNEKLFALLKEAAVSLPLDIWVKLDAGTPQWYKKMNRSGIPFEVITSKLKQFAACAPLTIQTMLCKVDGEGPPPDEAKVWEKLLVELALDAKSNLRKVQIYGKARPAPEDPKAAALPVEYLEERASSLRRAFIAANAATSIDAPIVEVFP